MGEFRERDRRVEPDFSGLEALENSESDRNGTEGEFNFTGVDQALSRIRSDDSGAEKNLEEPDEVLDDSEIDYESMRSWANHAYFVNSQEHLSTPENKQLDIEISAHYEEMTDALMGYLKHDGVEGLQSYVKGDLENSNHWTNLVGFGLIEGEQQLSNLGEYVADQVFQYSDR